MWSDLEEAIENKPAYRGHSLMAFIIGMPIPMMCIWLWTRVSTGPGCETFINKPILIFGILLLFFSISASCACLPPTSPGCCTRETLAFLLLCAFLGYGIFILGVSSPGSGHLLPGVGFQDYVLDDYSNWLQNRLNNTPHWGQLKSCLVKKNVCHKFFDNYVNDTQYQFFARHLSSIESGCCKPPRNCNFNYTSAVKWTRPKEMNNHSNPDCKEWNDDPNIRCFNCQSCKAGFANDVKSSWVIVGIVIVVVFSLVLFVSPCTSCKGGVYTACFMEISFRLIGRSLNMKGMFDSD